MILAVDVDTDALRLALVLGAVAALVAFTTALLWRRARPGVVGLPVAAAALFTIRHYLSPAAAPVYIFIAAGVAFAAGEIVARWEHPVARYLPVLGGVVLAVTPIPSVPVVARILAALAAVVTGLALEDLDRRHASQGLGVLLLAITCAAPLFISPGSAAGPALAGAAIFTVLLLIPKPLVRVGAGGAYAVAVAFWWAVLISAGWPQGGDNVVAGIVACGFILFEPLARAVVQRLSGSFNRRRSTRDAVWLVVATAVVAQGALVAYAAAVVARTDRVDLALLSTLPVAVGATLVATEVVPSPRRQSRRHNSE
ncbi:MAG TPA: hypothetical protein VGO03_06420 [Acidimicrobiia bacterium]